MSNKFLANKRKGERYDVYIGRPGPWGNPFELGKDGARAEVIQKYRIWLKSDPAHVAAVEDLRGKVLGCWCHPKPCHGDVLLEILYPENNLENFFTN